MGATSSLGSWGFYLHDAKFDNEPALRNNIFSIWFAGLLDIVEAGQRFIPQIINSAHLANRPALVYNSNQLLKFCKTTAKFIEIFSKDEQLFISNSRNQLVHSFLWNRHQDTASIKWCQDETVKSEKIPILEYHRIIGKFYDAPKSSDTKRILDDPENLERILSSFRERVMNNPDPFWTGMTAFLKDRDQIVSLIRSDEIIEIVI